MTTTRKPMPIARGTLAQIERHGDLEAFRRVGPPRQWLLQDSSETSVGQAAHGYSPAQFSRTKAPETVAHHGILSDGVRFLQKPFAMARLLAKIHETLAA